MRLLAPAAELSRSATEACCGTAVAAVSSSAPTLVVVKTRIGVGPTEGAAKQVWGAYVRGTEPSISFLCCLKALRFRCFPSLLLLSQPAVRCTLHAAWHPAAPASSSSAGHGATCGPLTLELVT